MTRNHGSETPLEQFHLQPAAEAGRPAHVVERDAGQQTAHKPHPLLGKRERERTVARARGDRLLDPSLPLALHPGLEQRPPGRREIVQAPAHLVALGLRVLRNGHQVTTRLGPSTSSRPPRHRTSLPLFPPVPARP